MKNKAVSSTDPQSPAESDRCLFTNARGHQCRMLRMESHRCLCPFHARQEQQILDAESVAKQLASISGDFRTANDINHALGKVFKLCAADRIPVRKAAVLAYTGQLLLHSLADVQNEYENGNGLDAWNQLVYDTVGKGLPKPAAGDPVPLGQSPAVARALRAMAQGLATKSAARARRSSVTNGDSPLTPSATNPSAGAVG